MINRIEWLKNIAASSESFIFGLKFDTKIVLWGTLTAMKRFLIVHPCSVDTT